ncbi:uncharacterized protein LOC144171867 [Haemaphysalis longicornis]
MIGAACLVLSLALCAEAGYIGAGYGLGYGISHFGVSRGIGYSTVTGFAHSIGHAQVYGYSLAPATAVIPSGIAPQSKLVTAVYHPLPAPTVPVAVTYHAPASHVVHKIDTITYDHSAYGYGLASYGLNYDYGLGTAVEYLLFLRKRK